MSQIGHRRIALDDGWASELFFCWHRPNRVTTARMSRIGFARSAAAIVRASVFWPARHVGDSIVLTLAAAAIENQIIRSWSSRRNRLPERSRDRRRSMTVSESVCPSDIRGPREGGRERVGRVPRSWCPAKSTAYRSGNRSRARGALPP